MSVSKSSTNEEKYQALADFISTVEDKSTALITVLHYAQGLFDYLPTEVQLFVAHELGIPAAKVYGVVTFYSFFTTKPRGKYRINVCLGTACFVQGSDKIYNEFSSQLGLENGEVTKDGLFSLHSVRCIGACGLAPVIMINDEVHGRVTVPDVSKIIQEYRTREGL